MEFIASAAFGLEGLVIKDLKRMGANGIRPLASGGVAFEGDFAMAFNANLWLRTSDRVLLTMGRFEARSFEELFQGVLAIEWEKIIPDDAQLPIKAQCARSQLMSPSDCQSIVKKAVAKRMSQRRSLDWMPETGAVHEIDVSIHSDVVTVALNMSGPALNRRGYRTWNGEAPLRETLAAAVVLCSPWRPKFALHDPCCGTGTLLIEAAYIALDRAPGLTREFDCEKWPCMPKEEMRKLRLAAKLRFEAGRTRPLHVSGSDIDPEALELCKKHIRQAGLEGMITLWCKDLRDITLPADGGTLIANPPYGLRLGNTQIAVTVAKQLGILYRRLNNWNLCAITGDKGFEKAFDRRADKRRRLYNGRLECELLTFNAK